MRAIAEFLAAHPAVVEGRSRVLATAGRAELVRLFAASGFTEGAEIGVWAGDFSKVLCERVPGLHLRAVDPWQSYAGYQERKNEQVRLDGAYQLAKAALARFNCTIVRKTSEQAAAEVPDGSLDFVYLDANHAKPYVLADLAAWLPKVRRGGVVSGHDYQFNPKPHIQVKVAVDAFARDHHISPIVVLSADKSPSWFWVVG